MGVERSDPELAGKRTIAVNAGEVGAQIFAARLVDEGGMDGGAVSSGPGKRYFGSVDAQRLLEDPNVAISAETAYCSLSSRFAAERREAGDRLGAGMFALRLATTG